MTGKSDEIPAAQEMTAALGYQTLAYSRYQAVRKTLGGEATAILLCYPARGEENAADRLAAALAGENAAAFRLDDVSLPVILLAFPTPSRAD